MLDCAQDGLSEHVVAFESRQQNKGALVFTSAELGLGKFRQQLG